jgi:hypothetical protein
MRLSQSRTGPRLFRAGIAAAATAAVVLAGTATPVLAVAANVTVSPPAGANSGSITATSSGFLTGVAAPATVFTLSACADPYATATTNISATTSRTSDDTATITVPATLALGANGVARPYNVCVYNGTTAGTSVLKGSGSYLIAPVATPTASSGPSGGGNTLTVNVPAASPVFGASSVPTTFATGGCPTTYGTPAISATATKVTTTQVTVPVPVAVGGPDGTKFALCFYAGTTTGSNGLIAASSATAYTVTLPAVTLSSTIGPESTTQDPVNLTITGSSTMLTGITAPAVVLIAATGNCGGLYPTSTGTNMTAAGRKVANNKAAFTMPIGATVAQGSSTDYEVCLYSSTSTSAGKLLGSATFTVANQPKITAVLPSSGPALGNSAITVTGSDFPTAANSIIATLGGVPLTSITPLNPNTFTAVTPAHAVGTVALTVTTALGTDTKPSAFKYENSIRISPNTAPSTTTAQDIDIQGTGFLNYAFDVLPNQGAHVYLVDGVYNGNTGTGNTAKVNGPVADCGNVLVISDNELICSLNLTAALNAAGTAVVANGYHAGTAATTANNNIVTLATGTFTQSDVGKVIAQTTGSDIPANTKIVAVLSPTTAVMSANANNTVTSGSAFAVNIGYQSLSISATGSQNGTTLTGSTSAFSQADVGRYVAGTGVGGNAVVVAVNDTGTTATLSVPNSNAVTSVVLSSGNPVPDGAYNLTVVSNADENAAASDTTYSQTVISSESIFTVAPF